jgi:hypothetical protein
MGAFGYSRALSNSVNVGVRRFAKPSRWTMSASRTPRPRYLWLVLRVCLHRELHIHFSTRPGVDTKTINSSARLRIWWSICCRGPSYQIERLHRSDLANLIDHSRIHSFASKYQWEQLRLLSVKKLRDSISNLRLPNRPTDEPLRYFMEKARSHVPLGETPSWY